MFFLLYPLIVWLLSITLLLSRLYTPTPLPPPPPPSPPSPPLSSPTPPTLFSQLTLLPGAPPPPRLSLAECFSEVSAPLVDSPIPLRTLPSTSTTTWESPFRIRLPS
ncbi:unnamed protein product [Closterium sp. NIES-54]